jgi:hypothetical protein
MNKILVQKLYYGEKLLHKSNVIRLIHTQTKPIKNIIPDFINDCHSVKVNDCHSVKVPDISDDSTDDDNFSRSKYPSPADCCMSGCKHCDYVY